MLNGKSETILNHWHARAHENLEQLFVSAFITNDFPKMKSLMDRISNPADIAAFAEKAIQEAVSGEKLVFEKPYVTEGQVSTDPKMKDMNRDARVKYRQTFHDMFNGLFSNPARLEMLLLWANRIHAAHGDVAARNDAAYRLAKQMPFFGRDLFGAHEKPTSGTVADVLGKVVRPRVPKQDLPTLLQELTLLNQLPADIVREFLGPMMRPRQR